MGTLDKQILVDSIEELPPFADEGVRDEKAQTRVWDAWEKLNGEGKLTQLQLMRLKVLIEAVHAHGVDAGASNPYC